jgi:hypothetical protein
MWKVLITTTLERDRFNGTTACSVHTVIAEFDTKHKADDAVQAVEAGDCHSDGRPKNDSCRVRAIPLYNKDAS